MTTNKAESRLNKEKNIIEKEELNKKLSALLIQYKDGRKKVKSLVPFNQPAMILLRSNRKAEFLESNKRNGLSSSTFIFDHSNGEERKIDMKGAPMYKLPYGNGNYFDAYIYHEDWAYPMIPEDPLIEFKLHKNSIQNAFSAEAKWQAELTKAKAIKWQWLVAGIAVLVVGAILYMLMMPDKATPTNVLSNLPQNVTIIAG